MKLTDTQSIVINAAADRTDGNIDPLPSHLRGGARVKVFGGLLSRGLIKKRGGTYLLTDEGYAAVGRTRPKVAPNAKAATDSATGAQETPAAAKPHRTRDNTKQATVIAMLRRPEGATIQQIVAVTGWQAHTVRGTFAGAFKKKLGLAITSTKPEDGERVYWIGA
jgi:Protein of unknown function (DUF3489)